VQRCGGWTSPSVTVFLVAVANALGKYKDLEEKNCYAKGIPRRNL